MIWQTKQRGPSSIPRRGLLPYKLFQLRRAVRRVMEDHALTLAAAGGAAVTREFTTRVEELPRVMYSAFSVAFRGKPPEKGDL